MTNPDPKRQWSPRPQPQPRELQEKIPEWKTFEALPPPQAKLGFPQTDTQPATETETQTADLASWRKRAGAFALDFGLGLGVSYLAQGAASVLGGGAEAVNMIGFTTFFGAWLVNRGYFQSQAAGQSWGKWLMSIQVVDSQTDQAPTLLRSMSREGVSSLLILTEALLVPLGADALFAAFDKEKRQSLHDRAARTMVVNAEEGFALDEKIEDLLANGAPGEIIDEFRETLGEWTQQVKKEETFKDVQKNVGSVRRQASKQVGSWVEKIRKTLDN